MTHQNSYNGKDGQKKKNQCWQACGAARTHTNGRAEQYFSDFRKLFDGLS